MCMWLNSGFIQHFHFITVAALEWYWRCWFIMNAIGDHWPPTPQVSTVEFFLKPWSYKMVCGTIYASICLFLKTIQYLCVCIWVYQNCATTMFIYIFSFLFYFVTKISKYCAWHIIGTHFIFVELINILPCSLTSASIIMQQKVVWGRDECHEWWFEGLTVSIPQLY